MAAPVQPPPAPLSLGRPPTHQPVGQPGRTSHLVDDAKREATVAALRDRDTRGAISLPELERRTQLALTAEDRGDLDLALADLQPATPAIFPAAGAPPTPYAVIGRGMSVQTADTIRSVIGVAGLAMFGLPMLLIFVVLAVSVLAG